MMVFRRPLVSIKMLDLRGGKNLPLGFGETTFSGTTIKLKSNTNQIFASKVPEQWISNGRSSTNSSAFSSILSVTGL